MIAFKIIAFVSLLSNPSHFASRSTDQTKLLIEVDNIRHTNGQVMRIAICTKDDFLKDKKPYEYAMVEVRSGKITHTFSVPKGEYAVSVFHDLNANNILDKNFFGAPSEPYGFSRNYKPVMRAPRFDEVKLSMTQDKKINISLIHP